MWRNTVVLDFVTRLHAHNAARPRGSARAVGFYGLDLYSLHASIGAVIGYLAKVDPEGARRARRRYACFKDYGEDPQAYGLAASYDLGRSCEDEAVNQLLELQRRAGELSRRDGRCAEDEFFFAEQNARLARNAEQYYRSMFGGRISSWNLRDGHMAETLRELVAHLDRTGRRTKVVVWAHNSHLGDARATQMGEQGELNLGQLVRQEHGRDAVLVGFTTYTGTVTAASDWDAPAELKGVRPALAGSVEDLFHGVGYPRFLLYLRAGGAAAEALRAPRLERAIGVIYRPQTERRSHYFPARLSDQFDAVLHFDRTGAVQPLDRGAGFETAELPETFPSGV
jgi:erythromycin esterase-like protein